MLLKIRLAFTIFRQEVNEFNLLPESPDLMPATELHDYTMSSE